MSQPLTNLRAAAKRPANQSSPKTIADFFRHKKDVLAQVLPRHMPPERMLRIAMTAIRANPKLMECTLESLAGAIITCGMLGLEPNPAVGHVYLIPFRNSKRGTTEVQVIPGYKGLIQLHRNTGMTTQFSAHPVYEKDHFEFEYGTEGFLRHRPSRERGPLIAAYAVARIRGDDYPDFEVCWLEEDILPIMHAALGKLQDWQQKQSPWTTHMPEMARKTAIRRLSKRLPISVEIARAFELENQAESGDSQGLESLLENYTEPPEAAPEEPPAVPAPQEPPKR